MYFSCELPSEVENYPYLVVSCESPRRTLTNTFRKPVDFGENQNLVPSEQQMSHVVQEKIGYLGSQMVSHAPYSPVSKL